MELILLSGNVTNKCSSLFRFSKYGGHQRNERIIGHILSKKHYSSKKKLLNYSIFSY